MGNHLGAQLWAGTLSLHPGGEALPSSSKVGLAGAGGSGAFFTSSGLPGHGELVLMTGDIPSCLLPPWRKSQLCCLGGPGLVPKCLGPLTSISWSTRPQQHQIVSIYHRFSGIGLQCCPNCCGVRMEVVKHPSQVKAFENKREDPVSPVLSPVGQEETGGTGAGRRTSPPSEGTKHHFSPGR